MLKPANHVAPLPLPAIPLPPLVVADTPCRQCGYDLRTLRSEGNCPECNAPVRLSLEDDGLLRSADPGWLGQVTLGVKIMVVTGVIIAVASTASFFGLSIQPAWIGRLCLTGGAFVLAFGVWLLTTPDPVERRSNPANRLGLAVRILLVIHLVSIVKDEALTGSAPGSWAMAPILFFGLNSAAQMCLLYLYIRKLVQTIPNAVLDRAALCLAILEPCVRVAFRALYLVLWKTGVTFGFVRKHSPLVVIIQFLGLVFLNAVRLQFESQLEIAKLRWNAAATPGKP